MAEDKAARAATFEDLLRVIKALNDERAEYLLIGGYAHGYQRATTDVDILVAGAKQGHRRSSCAGARARRVGIRAEA